MKGGASLVRGRWAGLPTWSPGLPAHSSDAAAARRAVWQTYPEATRLHTGRVVGLRTRKQTVTHGSTSLPIVWTFDCRCAADGRSRRSDRGGRSAAYRTGYASRPRARTQRCGSPQQAARHRATRTSSRALAATLSADRGKASRSNDCPPALSTISRGVSHGLSHTLSTINKPTWQIFHTFGGGIHLYEGFTFL
jgi:hypothetical protein